MSFRSIDRYAAFILYGILVSVFMLTHGIAEGQTAHKAKVALLPFENLSNNFLPIDDTMEVFYREMGKMYDLSHSEKVDEVIFGLRLRHTGYLTSMEAHEIGQRLGVEAVILGMICMYQEVPQPSIGIIMKMIGTGKGTPILWMRSHVAYGNQSEKWFGTERVTQISGLLQGIIEDVMKELPPDLFKKDNV